jgi:hypothetical protein
MLLIVVIWKSLSWKSNVPIWIENALSRGEDLDEDEGGTFVGLNVI